MKEEQTETASEKVSTVIPLNGLRLLVTFRNMELRIFDCSVMFGDDAVDLIIFDTVHADGSGVSWKNGITISSEKLYEDSIDLVDFLNEAISGEIKPNTQHDPFFVHGDDEIPDDFFHEQVKMIERTHYNYGQSSDSYRTAEAKSLHCSQFVAWVYYQSGYTDFKWTKAAEIQNRADMTNIPYGLIMPGDIGSVARDNGTGHCGIYLGTIGGVDYWCHSTTSGGIDGVRAGEYTSFNVYSRYNYLNDPAASVDAVDETAIVTYADIQSTEGEVDEVPVVEDNDVGVVEEDDTTDSSSTSSAGFGGEIVDAADASSTTEDSSDESASDEETEEVVEEEVVVDEKDGDDADVSVETTVDDEDNGTVVVDDVETSSDDAESSEDDEGTVSDPVQTADPYDLSLMIACAMLSLSGGSILVKIKRMNA